MRVFVAGDFCPNGRVVKKMAEGDLAVLAAVKAWTQKADYSIVNFECAIVTDPQARPIAKAGPCMKTNEVAADMVCEAGFGCVTLANNHFRDYGDEGCRDTIEAFRSRGIDYVGGGMNLSEAQRVIYKSVEDKRLAIVNFCENEFSIATDTSAGAAPLDMIDNYKQIREAREEADFVLVIVHGGHEHYQLPSPRMKKLYRHFVTLGADAVINHHQHCFSGYEYYEDRPIVYGLGNFCFDWEGARGLKWNEGYGVTLDFETEGVKMTLQPYVQCDQEPAVVPMTEEQTVAFYNKIDSLNSVIADDKALCERFEEWVERRRPSVLTLFSSYHVKFLNKLASKGVISRPASRREMQYMLGNVSCESHRDIYLKVMEREAKKSK